MIEAPSGTHTIPDPSGGGVFIPGGKWVSEPIISSEAEIYLYNPDVARLAHLFRAIAHAAPQKIVALVRGIPAEYSKLAVQYSIEVGELTSLRALVPQGTDLRPFRPAGGFLKAVSVSGNPAMTQLLVDEGILESIDSAMVSAIWQAADAHNQDYPKRHDRQPFADFAANLIVAGANVNRPFGFSTSRDSSDQEKGDERITFPPALPLEIVIVSLVDSHGRLSARKYHFMPEIYENVSHLTYLEKNAFSSTSLKSAALCIQHLFHLLIAHGAHTNHWFPSTAEKEQSRTTATKLVAYRGSSTWDKDRSVKDYIPGIHPKPSVAVLERDTIEKRGVELYRTGTPLHELQQKLVAEFGITPDEADLIKIGVYSRLIEDGYYP